MTPTELANMALDLISMPPIDDITSTSSSVAIACNRNYELARKEYLRLAIPGFARKDEALALVSGETSSVYTYVYANPSDCVIAREIFNSAGRSGKVVWEKGTHSDGNSSVILTDKAAAVLVYTSDITNLNAWPPDDLLALAHLLALKLANSSIKRDKQREATLNERFKEVFLATQQGNNFDQNFDFYSKRSFVAATLTPTDIANRALRKLGILPIDSITDSTDDVAIQCNEEYSASIKTYLKQASPSFARKEFTLVLASGETSDKYTYVYEYPTDCLIIREIPSPSSTDERIVYEVATHSDGVNKVIITDLEDATVVYTQNITDLGQFSDDDLDAIAFLLASKIGLVVPKDMDMRIKFQLVAKAEQGYIMALRAAMSYNNREQHRELQQDSPYIDARN